MSGRRARSTGTYRPGIAAEPESLKRSPWLSYRSAGYAISGRDTARRRHGSGFLGKVGRLPVEDYQPDARAFAQLQAIGGDQAGDDALLRAWSACFVEAGLRLRSVQDLLPDAVVPPGKPQPAHHRPAKKPRLHAALRSLRR